MSTHRSVVSIPQHRVGVRRAHRRPTVARSSRADALLLQGASVGLTEAGERLERSFVDLRRVAPQVP